MYETWLRSFHAVARFNGFTAAARQLNLSQPTITEQVKSLESRFEVELFHRHGRHVELTGLGNQLYLITQNIVGHTEEAVQLLRAEQTLPQGRFTLGSISPYDIMDLVKLFSDSLPQLTPVIAVDHREVLLQGLLDFKIDVAIIGRSTDDSRFFVTPHRQNQVKILVPRHHQWADQGSISIKDLHNAPMILREQDASTRDVFEARMRESNTPFRQVMEIDNREAIREAVSQGLGYGLATEAGHRSLPRDLVAISIDDAQMVVQTHLVCLKSRRSRPLIQHLLQLQKSLGN